MREVVRKDKSAPMGRTAEELMVSALYQAGRSGRTWKQAVGIYKRLNEKQGTSHYVPSTVVVASRRYKMIRFGSDDCSRRVSQLFPFVRGQHGGSYLVRETPTVEAPY